MKTKVELKDEKEKIIELEDYTRRENLKFHNIPESNFECDTQSAKQVILDILEKELQIARYHGYPISSSSLYR